MSRNKSIAIEAIAVMLVLVVLALTVFIVIDAGGNAFDKILSEKKRTESARVAFAYINMKIKQNDAASAVDVIKTDFGNALWIDLQDTDYCTFIFFADGMLYECMTRKDIKPTISAANGIVRLDGFELSRDGREIRIVCLCERGGEAQAVNGVVGLRT